MLESLFVTTATTTSLAIAPMLAAIAAALVLGLLLSWVYSLNGRATRSFVLALSILPAIVAVVIMAVGLVCGMGYVLHAAIVTVVLGAALAFYQISGLGMRRGSSDRTLTITIPEDLDYAGLFTDIFATFTTYHELVSVKTTNMGSLYKLTYEVGIADQADEKSMIDEIRCRNGNLEVALTRQETVRETL